MIGTERMRVALCVNRNAVPRRAGSRVILRHKIYDKFGGPWPIEAHYDALHLEPHHTQVTLMGISLPEITPRTWRT